MTNKAQLTEQQLQEELLDEIGDFTKAITRKIGQGVGGIKGAGQKVKGAVTRAGQGLKQAYTQGRDSAQQKVAGQDYKAPQPKAQAQAQAQGQAQPQGQTKTKPTGVMKNLAKNLGNVAVDTAAGDGYDYRKGVNPNPTKQVPVGKQDTQAQTQTQAQATKRTKTGGKVAGQVSNTASAQAQRDRRAAKKQAPGQTATQVPGQKKPPSAGGAVGATNAPKPKGGSGGSAVKQGMDQAQQKQPTTTAQNVGKKTGVNTAKIGGQKVDLNDPKMQNLRKAIEKASAGTVSKIDKLDPASKQKLKKAIS